MLPFLRAATILSVIAIAAAPTPTRAQISVGVEGGAVLGTFETRDLMKDGALLGVRFMGPKASAADWSLHVWLERDTPKLPAGIVIPPGLYVPEATSDPLYVGTVLAGLSRSADQGTVRPFVEGHAGLMLVREPGPSPAYFNQRRDSTSADGTYHLGPGFGFATGVQLLAGDDFMVELSGGVLWQPLYGAFGPTIPIRVSALWPAPVASSARDVEAGRFSLRWSGGGSRVDRTRGEYGWLWGVAGDWWLTPLVSLELQGEQWRHHSALSVGSDSLGSYTVEWQDAYTTLLAGGQVGPPLGLVRPYARAGLGGARASEIQTFGSDEDPTILAQDDRDGLACSVGLGLELPVEQRLSGFAETDVKWLSFADSSPLRFIVVRAGLALRLTGRSP